MKKYEFVQQVFLADDEAAHKLHAEIVRTVRSSEGLIQGVAVRENGRTVELTQASFDVSALAAKDQPAKVADTGPIDRGVDSSGAPEG